MKRIFLIILTFLCTICASAQEPQCVKANADGTVIIKAWGTGKNKNFARRDAEKCVINAILFTGVTKGVQSDAVKPVITTPNAREQREKYFDRFFKERGKYRNFLSVERVHKMEKSKNKNYSEWKCCIDFKVDLRKLEKRTKNF